HHLQTPEQIATASTPSVSPLRFPPKDLFAARAQRLRQLAAGHAMGDFLNFSAALADAQQTVLSGYAAQRPDESILERSRRHGMPPLDAEGAAPEAGWRARLFALLDALQPLAPSAVLAPIARLRALEAATLADEARAILQLDNGPLDFASAPLLAAALQVEWTARALTLKAADFTIGMETSLCPVCGSHPVASTVRIGDAGHGIRYAQCSLCACEWHVTRVKCVPCMDTRDIHTLSLETTDGEQHHPGVKVEICGSCHSSLKLMSMEKDPLVDPFADDLATLSLDLLADDEGFHRAGRNLFLFTP
ncbi:MAG: formate dehydrogenase accessory protein FdhE, partial [Rhodocyclaceae bacterium]|nr:formate dehydrogenase accessory protein FdhE [Rhodocyclaceae bacterium]